MTYRDEFEAALSCETPEQCVAFIEGNLAMRAREYGQSREEGLSVLKANLGYMAGYYDDETRRKIERNFGADHPIFGRATPTPEEAFAAGQKFAAGNATIYGGRVSMDEVETVKAVRIGGAK